MNGRITSVAGATALSAALMGAASLQMPRAAANSALSHLSAAPVDAASLRDAESPPPSQPAWSGESGQAAAPRPEFAMAADFAQQAAAKRNPFEPAAAGEAGASRSVGDGVAPDPNRPTHPLEAVGLEGLIWVGSISQGTRRRALLQDATGRLHLVAVGDYLGRNHGRVRHIDEADAELVLVELVADSLGGWRENVVFIGAPTVPEQP